MTETGHLRVDPTNADQARAWDGDEGEYWAVHFERFDRSLAHYRQPFMDAMAVGATDRVLDVGCGTGETARMAAVAAGQGTVLGVDLSSQMIEVARRLAAAEGLGNVRFEQADAQVHPFEADSYDLAVSRTGAMFFGDQVAAFTNIGRGLRPGGRLALLAWQPLESNEWLIEFQTALAAGRQPSAPPPDAPSPFALADPDRVRRVLGAAGFVDIALQGESGPMWFGHDADDATAFLLGLLGWMLEGLDDDGRARAIDNLRASTAAHEGPDGVTYGSGTWIITGRRA